MRGKDPSPTFSRQLNKSIRKVLALTVDFEDGSRETLEFIDGNWATYRVSGNEILDGNDHVEVLYDTHEIVWKETFWEKES